MNHLLKIFLTPIVTTGFVAFVTIGLISWWRASRKKVETVSPVITVPAVETEGDRVFKQILLDIQAYPLNWFTTYEKSICNKAKDKIWWLKDPNSNASNTFRYGLRVCSPRDSHKTVSLDKYDGKLFTAEQSKAFLQAFDDVEEKQREAQRAEREQLRNEQNKLLLQNLFPNCVKS